MAKTPALAPVVCNSSSLRAATRRISQLYEEYISPSGLQGTQYSVLNRIDRRGSATLNELAADLRMDRSTLGHNLRPLERDGLVSLGVDPDDRRSRVISLTTKGQKVLAIARPLWQEAHARFEKTFGAERSAKLRALLDEIASEDFLDAFHAG